MRGIVKIAIVAMSAALFAVPFAVALTWARPPLIVGVALVPAASNPRLDLVQSFSG